MPTDEDGELLVLVIDTAVLRAGGAPTSEAVAAQLLVFLRLHLLLNERNHVAVMAMHGGGAAPYLVSSADPGWDPRGAPGMVLDRLKALLRQPGLAAGEPALSGALSRALCYVHRFQQDGAARRARPRLLCVSSGAEAALQYIPAMNCIFAAQASKVVIDALVLGPHDSAYMQQAAHITGGVYARAKDAAAALQFLVTLFGADTYTRGLMQVPTLSGVDYRASCFCHKATTDVGWVCSVCLSIFCAKGKAGKTSCPTCGSPFSAASKP